MEKEEEEGDINLTKQIDTKRRAIQTDSYSMSVGELMNLYQDKELDLHPDFQRFFRWSPEQKTNLIESILLGIPIPSIFVSEQSSGAWDVIDGLQRLSTIFQFAGILKDKEGEALPPLVLESAKYLPALAGKTWEAKENEDPTKHLSASQRIQIKRAKINVVIFRKESDSEGKYDLFQRLNTGGTGLSDQEVRNCIMIMEDKTFYEWFSSLYSDESFQSCISLPERLMQERYDMELVLRFLIFRNIDIESKKKAINDNIMSFLTDEMVALIQKEQGTFEQFKEDEKEKFQKAFVAIHNAVGSNAFRKYVSDKDKFTGGFSLSAFEAITFGVGHNIDFVETQEPAWLEDKIKKLWEQDEYTENSGAGVSSSRRLPKIVPFSREYFSK